MALLRTAMDSAFGNLNISSTETLVGGCAKAVPGEPFPIDGARASRALRLQQLAIMQRGFPLGLIPSYSPTSHKDLGSFSLQSLRVQSFSNWWLALVAQIRPEKLIAAIKEELPAIRISNDWEWDWDPAPLKNAAKRLLEKTFDQSLYSLGLCLQASLTSSSSLLLSSETHGETNRRRTRAMLLHKLADHDITVEAGWPELYIDHNGKYWEVPLSLSLDCSSLISDSGLRYRFGIQKNGGYPQAVDSSNVEVPLALMPGLCAKAAFSFEKSKDLWRQKETEEDLFVRTIKGNKISRPAYDIRLKEPFAAISGIIGGICAAWIGGGGNSVAVETRGSGDGISLGAKKRSPFSADMFGSVCFTYQHGKFRRLFRDLTRLDARLDVCSASALAERVFKSFRSSSTAENPLSSPRLSFIFQQQVYGPIVFRVNSKFFLGSSSGKGGIQMEDLIYSLNYSLRLLQSGKIVAWYSPKRKEAMIELRLFEF